MDTTKHEREPIAIVGIGLRLPGGANDVEQLWQKLRAGTDAIGPVPRERWDARIFGSADGEAPGRTYAVEGGFLDQSPYEFDASFFSLAPREASQLDPQQRLLLEASWEALERAGQPPTQLGDKSVGVFVGGFCLDNLVGRLGVHARDAINSHTATSSTMTMLANRISHALDLHGPSLTVDTACSSSLVATHLACRSLWSGESELALAAGVNVILRPEYFLAMSKGGFLSRSGRCRAFDADADGYVRGEGVAVVALTPLSRALERGDEIHALILATGVNQDGRTPGISTPSAAAQEQLIRRVHADPAVVAERLVYVEAHGPGTPVGDPIEARSIGRALGSSGREPVQLGSIKTNLGHLEACAGVAGLIKAALVLERREVPPNLHFDRPNPEIDFEGLGLHVPTEIVSLPAEGELQAAVNSFGYGGTNAHAVLASPPARKRPVAGQNELERALPFVVTAADEEALSDRARDLAALPDPSLPRLGRTLGCRRAHLRERAVVWAQTPAQLREGLTSLAEHGAHAQVDRDRCRSARRLAFVYTGMGAQYHGMASELLGSEPVFRAAVERVDASFRPLAGWSIVELLDQARDRHGEAIEDPARAQPSNFAIQVGLTQLWRSRGLEPEAAIGHSVGELAAAWAAGALALDDAVLVMHHRARLQQRLAGTGGMLALGLGASELGAKIEGRPGLELAAINGPAATVVSGELAALAELERELAEAGVFSRRLRVAAPYHSSKLDALEDEFLAAITPIHARTPRLELFSTVTGARVEGRIHDARYFARNAREPVAFAAAMGQALAQGYDAFVEIGPHRVLSASIEDLARASGREVVTAASLLRGRDELDQLRRAFGRSFCAGVPVAFERIFAAERPMALPAYPWQRRRLWAQTGAVDADLGWTSGEGVLQQREDEPLPTWRSRLSAGFFPYLRDHVVGGEPLFPAAGYVSTALAAVHEARAGDDERVRLVGVGFERGLSLVDEPWLRTRVDLDARKLELWARADDSLPWRRHASARISTGPRGLSLHETWGQARARCPHARDVAAIYRSAAARGLDYGPSFRCIERLWTGVDEAVAELTLAPGLVSHGPIHPVLLDGAFQTLIALLGEGRDSSEAQTLVPVGLESIELLRSAGAGVNVHVRLRGPVSPSAAVADLTVFDPETEAPIVELTGLRLAPLPRPRTASLDELGFETNWHDQGPIAASEARVDEARVVHHVDCDTGLEGALVELIELVRELSGRPESSLTIVTRDAMAEGAARRCEHAGVWGFARVIANEHPELRVRLVDLPTDEHGSSSLDVLASTLRAADEREPELRLVAGRRLVPRLERWRPRLHEPALVRTDEAALRLHAGGGGVEDLRWVFTERRAPGPGEVEIATTHTSLNFKDLMKVMGMLDADYLDGTFFSDTLGMETAGRIVARGPDVVDYELGEEVVVPNPEGSFRSFATVATDKMIRRPGPLSLAESPAMISYVTAYHALVRLADLGPEDSVLIHSAAGGVGQAAIQVARWRGAKILATAGTEAKRERLRAQGIEHVFDSRSLAFVEGVLAASAGRGVDVVLNSLAGERLHASWELLASHARFVEIGKRDIREGHPLGLAGFDHNRSFHAVDIDQMMVEQPRRFRRLLDEVAGLLDAGALAALPTEHFAAAAVDDAFRLMSRGRHVGKIVVELAGQTLGATPDPSSVLVREDRAYLISGGLTGFGAALARDLARAGAGQLWLLGRRGPSTPGAAQLRAELERYGAEVHIEALDVSEEAELRRVLAADARLPLAGVFHAAMVLADGPVRGLERGALRRVLGPKIAGAELLDRLTRSEPVEHFVLFSSISATLGNPNQANYAAANAYLDALAHRRQGQGLPALSVNWGALADVGVVAREASIGVELAHAGVRGLTSARALETLHVLMRGPAAQVCVAALDWSRIARVLPSGRSPRFASLTSAPAANAADDRRGQLRARLLAVDDEDLREAQVVDLLAAELATVLEHTQVALPPDVSLEQLGVDSLMAVELSRRVEGQAGVVLPTNLLMRGPTLAQLAKHVCTELLSRLALDEAKLDALSEAEVDAMLLALAEAGELDGLLSSTAADQGGAR